MYMYTYVYIYVYIYARIIICNMGASQTSGMDHADPNHMFFSIATMCIHTLIYIYTYVNVL